MAESAARQLHALVTLEHALAERDVGARLDATPVPFLVIPTRHRPGRAVVVQVVRGRAAPDVYAWDHGDQRHRVADPRGAAARLAAHVRAHGVDD